MWGLVLGPLVAGYYFIVRSNYTKYRYEYLDRQAVLFWSAGLAIGSVTVVRMLVVGMAVLLGSGGTFYLERDLTVLEAALSRVLLVIGARLTSRHSDTAAGGSSKHLERAILEVGNVLDGLLYRAYSQNQSLLITLDNGKCYVVKVTSTPTSRETRYVEFAPLLSGYRDEAHELIITTEYASFFSRYPPSDFRLVVELADITSVQTWDYDKYEAVVLAVGGDPAGEV